MSFERRSIHGYSDRCRWLPGSQSSSRSARRSPAPIGRRRQARSRRHEPCGPGLQGGGRRDRGGWRAHGAFPADRRGSCVVVDGWRSRSALERPVHPARVRHADDARQAGPGHPRTVCHRLERGLCAHDRGRRPRLTRRERGRPAVSDWASRSIPGCWYSVAAAYDADAGTVTLYSRSVVNSVNSLLSPIVPISGEAVVEKSVDAPPEDSGTAFTIAGLAKTAGSAWVDSHLNGKVDRPKVWGRALTVAELDSITQGAEPPADGLLAAWDFAGGIGPKGIPTDAVTDSGPNGLHGRASTGPARGDDGWNWRGIEENFVHAPERVRRDPFPRRRPRGLPAGRRMSPGASRTTCMSGVYALAPRSRARPRTGAVLRPPPRGTATAKALFLVPTASYLAYANEHIAHDAPVGAVDRRPHVGHRRAGLLDSTATPSSASRPTTRTSTVAACI